MKDSEGMNALLERLDQETDQIDEKIRLLILRLWQWGIERICDDTVRKSVSNYYVARVPFQFFISPVSRHTDKSLPRHKRRHPYWHNEPGGIVWHIVESCIGANRLLTLLGFADESGKIDDVARDIVLAATLVTDTQKNGIPWGEKTLRNHGEIAAGIWDKVAIGCNLPDEIRGQITEAIFWHYGRYTQAQPPKEFKDLPDLVKIVNILDACSASINNELIYEPLDPIPPPED